MMEAKVSVVITVYNMETYLEECILSVVNQTFKNIEILIVNDGSTDNSFLIIEKYKNLDKRIKVFNIKNQGSSSARNVGIDNVKGDYIVFVDGDDYCMPSMIDLMYRAMVHNEAEVCVCNVMRINMNEVTNQSHREDYCIELEKYGCNQYIVDFIFEPKHAYCVWNRMYKSKVILENKIRFRDFNKIYPEDLLFNLEVILDSKRIAWINKPLYIHILRTQGLTKGYRPNIVNRYLNACDIYRNVLRRKNMYDYMEEAFYYVVQIETLCALKSLLRNNKATLVNLYHAIKNLYAWDFVYDAFNNKCKGSWGQRLVRWCIKKKYILFATSVIWFLYCFNIEFI